MSTAIVELTGNLANRLGMGAGSELVDTLKATAFKGNVSDSQMIALLAVANQYGLNPWTKEIYAFPDKNNGIVPVVGVDGWSRIINSNPQFDGMEFQQDEQSCTCRIFRKDRNHPIEVTEYKSECSRNTGPWQSHPKRMLRHKAMIQCARLAFGYVGIYDQDEAERIAEIEINPRPGRVSGADAAMAASKPAEATDAEREAAMNAIADLEIIAKEDGQTAFRAAWQQIAPKIQALIGIPERNRMDAIGKKADEDRGPATIEGEAKEIPNG